MQQLPAARVRIIARPPRTVSQNFLPTRACPRLGARLHVTFSAHKKEAGVGGMRGGEDEEEGGGGGGGIFFTTTSADAAD